LSDLDVFYIFMLFLFGACFGSFSNVIIYRLPLELSLMGRSQCTKCKNQVSAWHNIPMLSYFLLRGKCAKCAEPFSIRYPLVEFITAVLFSAVYFYYGQTWTTVEYLILVWALVVCSFIDLDHMILPDQFTLGGIAIGFIGAYLNPERHLIDAFWGFLFGGGILWLVAYVYFVFTGREGLGGGDIKLLAWLGTMLGWKSIPFIILTSSVFGTIVGLYISRKSTDKLKAVIPFGPFIALGAILYILGLKSAGLWYVDLFFPPMD
jgi:leader peptidase (prepilin peptidase) / N-methyltransferase